MVKGKDIQNAAPHKDPVPVKYEGPTGLADNITMQDLRLPRIALLQSKSPQVENDGDKYKAGMFIDTLTQDVLPGPVRFIPVFIFANVIKWKPRNEGGGMVWKTLNPTAEQLKELQWNETVKPTADRYINCVCSVPGHDIPFVISFCKTSLKYGQDLATLVTLSGQAWKYNYFLESVKVAGKQGTYYTMRVRRDGLSTADQLMESATLYEQVKSMSIETDYEGSTSDAPEVGDANAAPSEF